MRIGDILLEHGWIDGASLKRAVAEQRHTGKRLCSLLIARDLLDPDQASRALGEQHGVAAALQRHLEYRDPGLAALLPGPLARAAHALPIGRMRSGELIVCVRDPSAALQKALAAAIKGAFVLAVAPATQLESLIDLAYEPSAQGEFDVDVSTGPIVTVEEPMSDLSEIALVGLDDKRVSKDPSQSGGVAHAALRPTLPPPPPPPPSAAITPPTSPPARPAPALSLPATVAAITASTNRDEMTDLAMRYAAAQWTASLLLTVKEGAAFGHRGHGPQLSADAVLAVTVPLTAPSLVKTAYDTGQLATDAGSGAVQDRLMRLLGNPRWPAASPIVLGKKVGLVFVVGDPFVADAPHRADLERITDALGEGYARLVRETKKP